MIYPLTRNGSKQMKSLIQYQPDNGPPQWLEFAAPRAMVQAMEPADVVPALRTVEQAVADGGSAAGFITYEAASGLDAAMVTHPPEDVPLLRFGIYDAPRAQATLPPVVHGFETSDWKLDITEDRYREAIHAIKEWIACGETYQVNFTLRLNACCTGDSLGWFRTLVDLQKPRYAAWIADGTNQYCSVSPELFFELDGCRLTARPMKGTARRGVPGAPDDAQGKALRASAKDRSENVMIVDMMRNDMGRIARPGSVRVESLFDVERYPTVWQMTSTVRAETDAGFADVVRALFPSCSITGAPKVRTMQLIKQLESSPRGIYTGTMGFLLPRHPLTGKPGRFGRFNVAIRTAHVRRDRGEAVYGTGGGIVWDSKPDLEYRECLTKALILRPSATAFALLETMQWRPGRGIWLWREHVDRLAASADHFDVPLDIGRIEAALCKSTARLPHEPHRLRLLVYSDGTPAVEVLPIERARKIWRIVLDDRPIDETDPLMFHKTTQRTVYARAHARFPDADDVLLWNSRGEITESCIANIAVQMDGQWCTPPVACGLLNGTLRNALVRRRRLRERILYSADVMRAKRIILLNSVRGLIPAVLGSMAAR